MYICMKNMPNDPYKLVKNCPWFRAICSMEIKNLQIN